MTEEQRYIAKSIIMDDEVARAYWKNADEDMREFMLLIVLAPKDKLEEVKKILIEGQVSRRECV